MNFTLGHIGLTEDDVDLEIIELEDGGCEVRVHLSDRGANILEKLAASYGIPPNELLGLILRSALKLTPEQS